MFLCRKEELRKMERRYQNKSSECIIIYGRRRVGKTALINEFIKDKRAIYFPALQTNAKGNLIALSKAIQFFIDPNVNEAPIYSSFDAAFSEITRLAASEHLVFVIDELPYLVKSDASIPSRLQHLLDHDWAGTDLYVVLCGSSMSFMEKEVLSEKSPLFGRRTAQFKIEPLDYLDTSAFHSDLAPEENALIYGITGGIPHYINKLDVRSSIKNALLENFFDTSAYLFEEPENLLKQELREPAIYNSIITAIAGGSSKLNDIATKSGIGSAQCSKYLTTLESLGIIKKIKPVLGDSKRHTLYRITDNFFRFWYRFVPNNMMAVSSGNISRSYDEMIGSYLSDYMGLVFEDICRQYLISYAEDLPFNINSIGEWWGSDAKQKKEIQLDIVAPAPKAGNSKDEKQYIIGSCKYRNSEVDIDELALIRSYASAFANANDQCFYYIFSKGGFSDRLLSKQKKGEVKLISLSDLYFK